MDKTQLNKLVRDYFLASSSSKYNDAEISWLCASVYQIFLNEKSVLYLNPPIHICGDLHGQFDDLLRVFQSVGAPPNATFLFLGDYVDRGPHQIEVINLLFALKLRYPKHIFLLRGNHECSEMAQMFGFADECRKKISDTVLSAYNEAFEAMPLAAVIGEKIFCVHGGLSPSLPLVSDILKIRRPTIIPDSGPIADLLWSDPSPSVPNGDWGPNQRGTTFTWGQNIVNKFLKDNGLEMIIRAHQVAFEGFKYPFPTDGRVLTIFTSSLYAGEYKNKAAFVTVTYDVSAQTDIQNSKSCGNFNDNSNKKSKNDGPNEENVNNSKSLSQFQLYNITNPKTKKRFSPSGLDIKISILNSAKPFPTQIISENFSNQGTPAKKKPSFGRT
ncbi:hypothetical protein M9Y10_016749 [Tritrichomonas musculus]|uniref:Serine/threonine-protein phosphatase n=1 Tax=Tritrichomonas musculus TaxID=1915356 RepID=A0ABR2HX04_9EUKA